MTSHEKELVRTLLRYTGADCYQQSTDEPKNVAFLEKTLNAATSFFINRLCVIVLSSLLTHSKNIQ